MKLHRLFQLRNLACGLVLFQTSCSSFVASRGTNLGQYSDNRVYTRAEVIHQLGEPAKSVRFRKVTTVAELMRKGHPAVDGFIWERPVKVGRIDEYVIRGPISNDKDVLVLRGLAIVTLGASELVFLPVAIKDHVTSLKDERRLYMVYGPSDILVVHRTDPPW